MKHTPVSAADHSHGEEIARFEKSNDVIRVMEDGCLISERVLYTVGLGHTATPNRYSAEVRAALTKSGYVEEEKDIFGC